MIGPSVWLCTFDQAIPGLVHTILLLIQIIHSVTLSPQWNSFWVFVSSSPVEFLSNWLTVPTVCYLVQQSEIPLSWPLRVELPEGWWWKMKTKFDRIILFVEWVDLLYNFRSLVIDSILFAVVCIQRLPLAYHDISSDTSKNVRKPVCVILSFSSGRLNSTLIASTLHFLEQPGIILIVWFWMRSSCLSCWPSNCSCMGDA